MTTLNIINIIIGIVTIFLVFIYFKSSSFKSIPCYFNLGFCFIIILNNFLRLYHPESNTSFLCKAQGFALSLFDKLFITSITIYSLITYIYMINPEYYKENMKFIYFILIIINVIFSLVLTIIFILQGMSESSFKNEFFCYVNTGNNVKKITDAIYTCILLIIDLFCVFRILCKIYSSIKQCDDKYETKKKNLRKHYIRFILALFLNIITFGFLFLIVLKLINEYIPFLKNSKDIIFVVICFIDELFYTMNMELYKETMRILTCNKVERFKNQNSSERNNSNESNEERYVHLSNEQENP